MITTLNKLKLDNTATIYNLNCENQMRRRLQDLGIIKGAKITPRLNSPSSNLVAYDIKGSLLAIRNDDSKNIEIELILK